MPPRATAPNAPNPERQAACTQATYHEVEIGPGRAFQIDHCEGAQIVPLGGEPIGGGAQNGGWMFKYVLLEPAQVLDER